MRMRATPMQWRHICASIAAREFKTAHSVPAAARAILDNTVGLQKEVAVFNAARLKVLIADDEPIIADTLAMILEQDGYQAEAVYGGRQAVEKARRWTPDLFLSDVNMPELPVFRPLWRSSRSIRAVKCCCFPANLAAGFSCMRTVSTAAALTFLKANPAYSSARQTADASGS